MNPLDGVPITPHKNAQRSSSSTTDLELLLLAKYLVSIATSDDLMPPSHLTLPKPKSGFLKLSLHTIDII